MVRRCLVTPPRTLAVALLMTTTALAQQGPATPAQAQAPSPYAAPQPSVAGWRMEFRANDPRARLEIRDLPGPGGDDDDEGRFLLHWRMLCGPSCETVVDPHATLRVGGPGLVPSEPFTLERPIRVARVWATATPKSRRNLAYVGATLGGAAVVGGLGMMAGGMLMGSADSGSSRSADATSSQGKGAGLLAGGVAVTVAGILALVAGISFAQSSNTTVTQGAPPPAD